MSNLISHERLRELLNYNPETGEWRWIKASAACVKVGTIINSTNDHGYIRFSIDCKSYYGHRLAWIYMTGEWPADLIDHIDGNRKNNRWNNLRSASRSINIQNQKKSRKDNKLGILGVCKDGKKYRAQITINGSNKSLGSFPTPEEAHLVYLAAKRELHAGCTI